MKREKRFSSIAIQYQKKNVFILKLINDRIFLLLKSDLINNKNDFFQNEFIIKIMI